MKELTGSASATTAASPEACLSFLEALDGYPNWYPEVVKSVEVLERDAQGRPSKVQCKLHVERGAMTRDFDLTMEVMLYPPGAVRLNRIPHHGRDGEKFEVNWFVRETQPTEIQLNLVADLDVPRFLPLGGIGNSMADGFVSAATRALAS